MRYPWVNTALLILLLVLLLTGFGGLISGSERLRWILWLHSAASYAVVILLAWKSMIIVAAFKRRRSLTLSRIAFLILTCLLLATLVTGLIWTLAGPIYIGGMSLLVLHGFLAVGLIGLFVWHTFARRFILRVPQSRDRRAALRLTTISLVGVFTWNAAEVIKRWIPMPGAQRRFTGSYETGSFTGVFPPTSWLFDYPQPVAVDQWQLVIDGAVERVLTLDYAGLLQLAEDTRIDLLDCTGGWYTEQEWTGVTVARLLKLAGVKESAQSIMVEAVSGYGRRFALDEARSYILATHVAGQPLSHGHGFPVRLVAQGHRGFDWVKWVTRIQVNETSHLQQPPIPLQ
jgi:hypothetical protein